MRSMAALAITMLLATAISANERPNVLMILVDDLKPTLGCYGDPHAITPNIDSLAADGMRFESAYCNQAVCAPSRFTLMLGSHSTSTGLYGLGSQLREVLPHAITLPQHFAANGYRTESLGKVFHIGHGNHGDPESFMVPHFKEKVIEYVEPQSTDGELTREEAYFTNRNLNRIKSLPRGAAFESPDVPDDAYADGRVAGETIRRLRSAKRRRDEHGTPFFIATGFARPHLPFSVPKKYWDLYDPKTLPQPRYEELPMDAPSIAGKRGGEISNYKPVPEGRDAIYDEALKRKLVHGYYASVSYVDAQIGKVLDELRASELDRNTIVVLWGDHGFHLGDLGIWTKHTNYEQATRIPILIAAPGVTDPGSSTAQLTESVDLYPTLSDLAGLPAPKGPQPIDGKSLAVVLKDPSVRVRDHAYHIYPRPAAVGRAVRTDRYRLVQWMGSGPDGTDEFELYDYQDHRVETENVYEQSPAVAARLASILRSYPDPISRSPRRDDSSRDVGVPQPAKSPNIAGRSLLIKGEVISRDGNGVIVAQGGVEHGYSVHLRDGVLTFDVRIDGNVRRLEAETKCAEQFVFQAVLDESHMSLSHADGQTTTCESPGLIPVQPADGLNYGFDDRTAAGNYTSPNPLRGKIRRITVEPR